MAKKKTDIPELTYTLTPAKDPLPQVIGKLRAILERTRQRICLYEDTLLNPNIQNINRIVYRRAVRDLRIRLQSCINDLYLFDLLLSSHSAAEMLKYVENLRSIKAINSRILTSKEMEMETKPKKEKIKHGRAKRTE